MFDSSLWSLKYELLCYVLVLVLMVVGATRRRTGFMLVAFGMLVGLMLQDWLVHDRFGAGPVELQRVEWPIVSWIDLGMMVPLAAVFLLGGLAAARPQNFVVDGRLAALAALVAVGTMRYGGFDVFGVLAFSYVVLWMATLRTPRVESRRAPGLVVRGVHLRLPDPDVPDADRCPESRPRRLSRSCRLC